MELKSTHYETEGALATIMLSRPARRNAWTGRMHTEYRWCLAQADADPQVRVIVVTGDPAGSAFCAGADFAGLEAISAEGQYDAGTGPEIANPGYGLQDEFDATFAYHFGLSKPTIAAMNGAAAGVGLVLAAFCDLRFAAAGAKFTSAHGRFNFPAEYGLSWILPRIIGITRANDVLLSGRVFLAEEALEMGFLNRVTPAEQLLDEVYAYATAMSETCSPGSLRATRRQVYLDQHRSAAAAVVDSERLIDEMVKQPDYKEGVRAWMAKTPPQWSG
jgi:enoyl-CoA hydratase/carnithine racemase